MTSTPQSSPDWDRLHEKIASDNNASRKAAVRDARTTFVNHLTALGFPPYKGQVFEATLAAAKAGYVPGYLLGDIIWAINKRNGIRHSGGEDVCVDVEEGHLLVEILRDACITREVLNEPVKTIQPTPVQRRCLEVALRNIRSKSSDTKEDSLSSCVELLETLQEKTETNGHWQASLKAAAARKISGSLAARLLLAIRLRDNIEYGKKFPFTDDDLLDGVSSICSLFGIMSTFVPATPCSSGKPADNSQRPAQQNFDSTSQRQKTDPLEKVASAQVDTGSRGSTPMRAAPPTVATMDHARPAAATAGAMSSAGPGAGYWAILDGSAGKPYYREFNVRTEISRTELRGADSLDVVKALPPRMLTVQFVRGIPYLEAVTDQISLSLDGRPLRTGERAEITDAISRLKIGDITLQVRRVWHVP